LFESQGVSWKSYLATAPTGEISFKQESDYWLDVAVTSSPRSLSSSHRDQYRGRAYCPR
jgi:hypothetical protein